MARVRPRVVAFNVVETLMSLEPLRHRFVDVGLPGELLERWFDRLVRDGMALTLACGYEPFPRVAAAALRTLARGAITDGQVTHVLSGFAELPAHADAEPAMRQLAGHDITMVCLSNGAAQTTSNFLRRTGLDSYVDQVISVADVRGWKPPARVYHHALDRIGRPAGEVALVAVHAFDLSRRPPRRAHHRLGQPAGRPLRRDLRAGRRHRSRSGRRRQRTPRPTAGVITEFGFAQAKVPSQVVSPYRAP